MQPHRTPSRTPLRRVSRGSLAAISRSGSFPDAPYGLGFMGPALENLADEAEALHDNVEGLHELSRSLLAFNESFASYLYVQKVNTFCVEWFQAPIEGSHELAQKRAEEAARATALALERAAPPMTARGEEDLAVIPDRSAVNDTTYAMSDVQSAPESKKPMPKKKVKPKMTAKEKKERNILLEKVCSVLPIEFRGSDPTLRRQAEHVIESLMDAGGSLKITDMIKADINQAKVNKCLIALVNRKVVQRTQGQNGVVYSWKGLQT